MGVDALLPGDEPGLDAYRAHIRELEARRATIIASIDEQGKLTPALRQAIVAAATKARLEELIYAGRTHDEGENDYPAVPLLAQVTDSVD